MKKDRKEKSVKNNVKNNSYLLNRYSLIIGIFLAIVLIRIILSLSMYSPFIMPDELAYDGLAQNILHGHLSSKITGPVGPGYPVILSTAYLISNDKAIIYHIMLTISAIISASIIFPAYFILRKYCSDTISVLGAFTVTVLPFLTFFSLTLMTENLFTPLFIFSLWFLIESFGTDDKKWQILASASIVYLYITKSTAVAMMVGLVAAFVYYVIVSSKGKDWIGAIAKKSFLLMSFAIFLLSWLIYSLDPSKSVTFAAIMVLVALCASYLCYRLMEKKGDMAASLLKDRRILIQVSILVIVLILAVFGYLLVFEKESLMMNFGSSYQAESIAISVFQVFSSAENTVIGSLLFINEILYVIVCSFFAMTVIVFYYIFYKKKTYDKASPLTAGLIYALGSLIVLALTVVGLRFYSSENIFMMGRYVEPIIPAILLYSIIYIYDMKNVSDKQLFYYIGLFVGMFVISLFLMEFDYSVIYGFNEYVNNPSLVYLEPLYRMPLPEFWVLIYSLVFMVLMYVSIKNKRYISAFLAFIIISSLIPSADLYGRAVDPGNFRVNNPINLYLNANTDRGTHLYIDENMTDLQQKVGLDVYAFWNKGYTEYLDTNSTGTIAAGGSDAYLISVNQLQYQFITNDDIFKLYKI